MKPARHFISRLDRWVCNKIALMLKKSIQPIDRCVYLACRAAQNLSAPSSYHVCILLCHRFQRMRQRDHRSFMICQCLHGNGLKRASGSGDRLGGMSVRTPETIESAKLLACAARSPSGPRSHLSITYLSRLV